MGAQDRKPSADLARVRAALESASSAEFFALVARLERLMPGEERIGGDGPPRKETLRFRHDPSMAFAAGDVAGARLTEVTEHGQRGRDGLTVAELTTTFLGLTGSSSPLPLYISAEVAQTNAGENIQRDFLDIFHHRLIALFYRLWARYRYADEYRSDGRDAWSMRLATLADPSHSARHKPSAIPTHCLLRLAPVLAQRNRSAGGLALALEEVLGVGEGRVRITELVGGWTPLEDEVRMQLGHASARLGQTAVLGARAYDRANRFAICIGPLTPEDYPSLMPKGEKFPLLQEVVRLVLREPLDYDLRLELGTTHWPGFSLGRANPGRLGRTTRLRSDAGPQTVDVRNAGALSSTGEECSHAR